MAKIPLRRGQTSQFIKTYGAPTFEEAVERFQTAFNPYNYSEQDRAAIAKLQDYYLPVKHPTGIVEMVEVPYAKPSFIEDITDDEIQAAASSMFDRTTLNALAAETLSRATDAGKRGSYPVSPLDLKSRSADSQIIREFLKRHMLDRSEDLSKLGYKGQDTRANKGYEAIPFTDRTPQEAADLAIAYMGDMALGQDRITGAPLGKVYFLQTGGDVPLYIPVRAHLQGGHDIDREFIKSGLPKMLRSMGMSNDQALTYLTQQLVNRVDNQRLEVAGANVGKGKMGQRSPQQGFGRYKARIEDLLSQSNPILNREYRHHLNYLDDDLRKIYPSLSSQIDELISVGL